MSEITDKERNNIVLSALVTYHNTLRNYIQLTPFQGQALSELLEKIDSIIQDIAGPPSVDAAHAVNTTTEGTDNEDEQIAAEDFEHDAKNMIALITNLVKTAFSDEKVAHRVVKDNTVHAIDFIVSVHKKLISLEEVCDKLESRCTELEIALGRHEKAIF